MVYQIKLLVVVLGIAWIVFAVARVAFRAIIPSGEMQHYRTVFMAVTAWEFLAPSGWMFFLVLAIIIAISRARMKSVDPVVHMLSLWTLLVMAVPSVSINLQGFGGINRFIEINHLRVLVVILLVPILVRIRRQPGYLRYGSNIADWAVLGYALLQIGMNFQGSTFTNLLRIAVQLVLDILVPYWVLSRAFTTLDSLKRGLVLFVCCGLVLCCIAPIESVRHWPIYQGVESSWGVNWGLSNWLMRSGFFRAQLTGGHSLVFGMMCLVVIGFWTYVQEFTKGRGFQVLGHVAVGMGMLASLARGSWVGVAILLTLVSLLGTSPSKNVSRVAGVLFLTFVFAPFIPGFDKLLDLLPFVGTGETHNVDYRQELFETSISLIRQSPWLGVPNYLAYMDHLKQGLGFVDMVNSYLGIALSFGVIGLSLYLTPFFYALTQLWQARARAVRGDDQFRLAGALISTTFASLVVIATTSSISIIPTLLTFLVGLSMCVARLQPESFAADSNLTVVKTIHPRDRATVQAWQPR